MSFALQSMRRRKAMSLTPMIDVVFLLLVFFMLAARFDQTTVIPVATAGGGADYSGPPRLVDVTPDTLLLNGVRTSKVDLAVSLGKLMESPTDIIVLRARDNASVQRLVDVMQILREEGLTTLTLVE